MNILETSIVVLKEDVAIAKKDFGDYYFVPNRYEDIEFHIEDDKVFCVTKNSFKGILNTQEFSVYYLTREYIKNHDTRLQELDEDKVIWELD